MSELQEDANDPQERTDGKGPAKCFELTDLTERLECALKSTQDAED